MRKRFLFCIFVFFLVLHFVSAVEIEMKDSYDSGETLLVKVSGLDSHELSSNNVFLYRGDIRDPTLFDFFYVEDSYYLLAQLPSAEANYSLVLKDVDYLRGDVPTRDTFYSNFTISNETAVFSFELSDVFVDPLFELSFENLLDNSISVDYFLSGSTFASGDSGEEVQEGFWASIFGKKDSSSDGDITPAGSSFELGSLEKKDVGFNLDGISSSGLRFMHLSSGKTSYDIPLYFLVSEEIPGNDTAEVNSTVVDVDIVIVVNDSVDDVPPKPLLEKCSEMGGSVCKDGEKCDKDLVVALDGNCCVGKCEEEKKGGSSLKIIGWLLVVVVVIFLLWFFLFKFKGTKRSFDLMDVAKKGAGKGI